MRRARFARLEAKMRLRDSRCDAHERLSASRKPNRTEKKKLFSRLSPLARLTRDRVVVDGAHARVERSASARPQSVLSSLADESQTRPNARVSRPLPFAQKRRRRVKPRRRRERPERRRGGYFISFSFSTPWVLSRFTNGRWNGRTSINERSKFGRGVRPTARAHERTTTGTPAGGGRTVRVSGRIEIEIEDCEPRWF